MEINRGVALSTLFALCLALSFTGLAMAASQKTIPQSQPTLYLTLNQAIELALKNNRDLQTARRNINVAASNYRAALAGYYPVITGNISTGHGVVNQLELQPRIANQFSAGIFNIDLNFPLDLNGAIGRAVQQSLITLITVKANYSQAAQLLLDNVFTQYTDILRAAETIKIDQAQVDQAAEQLRIAHVRLKKGRIPEGDVLTAKVQSDNAKLQLKVDENLYDIAVATLRNTLVIDQHVNLIASDNLNFFIEKFNYNDAVREGIKNRLEMQVARLSLESARISLKSTYDQYKPYMTVSGNYGYNFAGRSPREAVEQRPKGPLWEITATLTVPIFIFDGGVIKESKIRAITAIEQAEANIQQTKETIELDVKNLLVTLENTQERVKIMQGSIKQAQESLRIAELRYRMGLSSYLEVSDARNNLRTAELNTLTAIRDHTLAREKMYRAIGRPLVNLQHLTRQDKSPIVKADEAMEPENKPTQASIKASNTEKSLTDTKTHIQVETTPKSQNLSSSASTETQGQPEKTTPQENPKKLMGTLAPAKPSPNLPPSSSLNQVKTSLRSKENPNTLSEKVAIKAGAVSGPQHLEKAMLQGASEAPSLTEGELKFTRIWIFNGSGLSSATYQIRQWLLQAGFNKIAIGKDRGLEAEKTLIYYRADAAPVAKYLAAHFFPESRIEETAEMPKGIDINIILGEDRLE